MARTRSLSLSSLRGVPQRITGRYLLCGLEMMPAFIAMVAGVATLVIAAAVAGITRIVVQTQGAAIRRTARLAAVAVQR